MKDTIDNIINLSDFIHFKSGIHLSSRVEYFRIQFLKPLVFFDQSKLHAVKTVLLLDSLHDLFDTKLKFLL